MASELRVNTLKDASGNNSVATETVAKGSAKVFSRAAATQDSILDSFNQTTFTDVGTGQFTVTLTNALSNTNYIMVTAAHSSADRSNTTRNIATSNYDMQCFNQAGSTSDTQQSSAAFGDLA